MIPQTYFTNQIRSQTFPIILGSKRLFARELSESFNPFNTHDLEIKVCVLPTILCFVKPFAFCYLPFFEMWFEQNIQTMQDS